MVKPRKNFLQSQLIKNQLVALLIHQHTAYAFWSFHYPSPVTVEKPWLKVLLLGKMSALASFPKLLQLKDKNMQAHQCFQEKTKV